MGPGSRAKGEGPSMHWKLFGRSIDDLWMNNKRESRGTGVSREIIRLLVVCNVDQSLCLGAISQVIAGESGIGDDRRRPKLGFIAA